MMNERTKTVVIVGRVNVGKSSLFNCLTKSREAMTSPNPRTTCDRKYGLVEADSQGRFFKLVDTGGVDLMGLKDSIASLSLRKMKISVVLAYTGMLETAILRQTKAALREADLLLMLVDAQQGLRADDRDLAEVLKKMRQPKILVCNKIDTPALSSLTETFKQLELGEPVPVSSLNGRGVSYLSKLVADTLKLDLSDDLSLSTKQEKPFRIVMVGRPGVGKSSLFNQMLGEELAVVSESFQTTVDSHDGSLTYCGKPILLTDTPGLLTRPVRSRTQTSATSNGMKMDAIDENEEVVAEKTLELLKNADAILFITEVTKSLCGIDQGLAHAVNKAKKPTVIVANKWDAFPRKDKEMTEQINIHYRNYLPKLSTAPVIFTSAKTGEGTKKILEHALNPLLKT